MLPTNSKVSKGSICLHDKFGLGIHKSEECSYDGSVRQHLYITDDSEIKEGDWYYWLVTNTVQCFKSFNGDKPTDDCKKIIGTTNPELTGIKKEWEELSGDWHKSSRLGLPQIQQSFIESYCKNPVDKVMVEYTRDEDSMQLNINTKGEVSSWYLKLTSNNEIIIHPIEEKMYTEGELIQFVLDNRFRIDSDTCREEIINWIKK